MAQKLIDLKNANLAMQPVLQVEDGEVTVIGNREAVTSKKGFSMIWCKDASGAERKYNIALFPDSILDKAVTVQAKIKFLGGVAQKL
jgi:hypothetical protein